MSDITIEKRFGFLCEITRAQHFAWREAVRQLCPDVDPSDVADRMWELTGNETAKAYSRRLDLSRPLAEQIAESIVWSSQCMGENAGVEAGDGGDAAFVRHAQCPWFDWHDRLGLLAEDCPGCDRWFASTLRGITAVVGKRLQFETLEALPDGGRCCLRRIWVEV